MELVKNPQVQPNAITQARYDYTKTEKRIVYFIIKEVQKFMSTGIGDLNLFNDLLLRLPIKDFVENDSKNYNQVKDAAKSLRSKNFEINTPDGGWLIVGFINYAEYNAKTKNLELEISKKIQPVLYELAQGFTAYSLTVALSLKSQYSQRFYEFCQQWKDTGRWVVYPQELKERLKVEKKYPKNSDFKRKVIDVAQEELAEKAKLNETDVWFTYEEKKKGAKVIYYTFTIHWKDRPKGQEKGNSEDVRYISTILKASFREQKYEEFISRVLDGLMKNVKLLKKFTERLEVIEAESYEDKKPLTEYAALIRYILKEDYKIK